MQRKEPTVYVVFGESDWYGEDSNKWAAGAWYNKNDAMRHAKILNDAATSLGRVGAGKAAYLEEQRRLAEFRYCFDDLVDMGDYPPRYTVTGVEIIPEQGRRLLLEAEKGHDAKKSE